MPDYLFFRVPFAFLDYEKAGALVFLENVLMLSFWAFIGTEVAFFCRNSQIKTEEKKNPLLPVVFIMGAIILGLVINMISGGTNKEDFGGAGWSSFDTEVAYFSWGGNTRGIAQEIQSQTGADIFEISPVEPYSTDYNTVLMEAQEDQHNQARPELSDHVENMDDYYMILLGYPNWWASIPMPIASFLEEYDFSVKRIIPFCSHGGGRFGQSLTAIAKLAPDADIGYGLSVHYSGGSTLSEDIQKWLDVNGINK